MSGVPRLVPVVFAAVLALAACGGGGGGSTSTATGGSVAFARGSVTISTGEDEVVVPVEIADSEATRELGLMNRTSLPPDDGMLFVFPAEQTGVGFWMKDTLIPLSVAFADGEGRIVRILDMEPCKADPCKVYDPGAPFQTALEANRGAFARWGVDVGDTMTLAAS
jgi:uncharacterized membrane protein (UPF0127 family)